MVINYLKSQLLIYIPVRPALSYVDKIRACHNIYLSIYLHIALFLFFIIFNVILSNLKLNCSLDMNIAGHH